MFMNDFITAEEYAEKLAAGQAARHTAEEPTIVEAHPHEAENQATGEAA